MLQTKRNCHSTNRELGSTTIDFQYFLEKCLRIEPSYFLTLSFPTCLRVLRLTPQAALVFSMIFFQAEDGIRDVERSRGLGDVYKRQPLHMILVHRAFVIEPIRV